MNPEKTTPDIIGIVKELQGRYEKHGFERLIHARGVQSKWSQVEILRHFPAIAQALLVAVDALENARLNCIDDGTDPQSPHYGIVVEAVDEIDDALSKIRSL